jgi:hypothetical protein
MTDEIAKVLTERGEGRDLSRQPYSVTVNGAGAGADWFGPLQPMKPIAPPEVAGRALDYIPGYNLTTQPRFQEVVDFQSLRNFAEAYDPLRLVIERRKDQLTRMSWTIRAKHEGYGKRPKTSALPASVRERIKDVEAFFKKPDYETGFRGWLRALLEDLFVLDAPSLYCERDTFNSLTALRVVDGATIKRVIDDWGHTPRPLRWNGQPFTWNGQTITAENHASLGFRVEGGLIYPPAYQQVLKGLPAVDYTVRDLIYRPLNYRPGHLYGCSPVQQIMTTTSIAMRRAFSQLEYYREGNQPEGFFALPASWSPDQVSRFQDYFDNLFSGNLAQRRKIKFMAGEGKYQPIKEPPLKNEMDEWLTRIVCFAFSYPPNAFVHMLNRATSEQHEKQAEEEGLQPTKQWAADLFNEVIEREFSGADEIEFAWAEEDEIDQEKQSKILTAYADSGALTLNEVRERIGEEPSPDPAAGILSVKTATGRVPISAAATSSTTESKKDGQAAL